MISFKLRVFSISIILFIFSILPSMVLAQTQSHPLSEIWPIDVNLNMSQKNITNVSYFFLSSGRYIYDTGSLIGLSSGLQLGGNLNLNSFSLIAGNWINASNFNVSNQLCLGGICQSAWPVSSSTGTPGYLSLWVTSTSLGNSLINQTGGNVWITAGNLNILSGALQIGGTSVIDSSRNIVNVNWVNVTNLNASNALYAQSIYEAGASLASKYVPQTRQINTGAPLTGGGSLSSDLTLDISIPICTSGQFLTSSDGNSFVCQTPAPGTAGGWTDEGTIVRLTTATDSVNATSLWINNTAQRVGIGTYSPAYALHVIGDVGWTGSLQLGTVPWTRLSGYDLNVAWSNKLGWGNLTGYNLNVAWTGSLGGGNITAGTITTAQIADNAVTLAKINQTSCPSGFAIRVIGGGTYVCEQINATSGVGNVSGSGIANALAYWTGNSVISAFSWGSSGQFLKSQGSGSQPIWDTIDLGTDTEGNYVAGINAGSGIQITGSPGEGWSPTVSLTTTGVTAGSYGSASQV
ncbi:MAG: hypothetical protein QXU15_03660, partial [Candidatus Aenigmatarchaeota archaeon]